jgi:hypothetical protein
MGRISARLLHDALCRALAAEPDERFSSIDEFLSRLTAALRPGLMPTLAALLRP